MNNPRAFVACDPGSRRSGLAAVTPRGNVLYAKGVRAVTFAGMVRALGMEIAVMVAALYDEGFRVSTFCVEDQTYRGRRDGKTKKSNPQHLIPLAQVAGSAWTCLDNSMAFQNDKVGIYTQPEGVLVPAMTWKGSVPKAAHHRRLCTQLGWKYKEQMLADGPRIVPVGIELLYNDLPSDVEWPDVLDAIGLARWLAKEQS